ncbi:MAG: hypothetical protein ACYC05_12490 [Sulfuricella sp.]
MAAGVLLYGKNIRKYKLKWFNMNVADVAAPVGCLWGESRRESGVDVAQYNLGMTLNSGDEKARNDSQAVT